MAAGDNERKKGNSDMLGSMGVFQKPLKGIYHIYPIRRKSPLNSENHQFPLDWASERRLSALTIDVFIESIFSYQAFLIVPM